MGLLYHLGCITKSLLQKAVYKDTLICNCKKEMNMTTEYLFLLPISFGHEHEESPEYYIQNGLRIHSLEEIPAGKRAYYLRVFKCPECGNRRVCTTDFLKVRENTTVKSAGNYAYGDFAQYLSEMV